MKESTRIAKVTRIGTTLPIDVSIHRIVAISEIDTCQKEPIYYIYFENAVWTVKADSYDDVCLKWVNFLEDY